MRGVCSECGAALFCRAVLQRAERLWWTGT